MLLTPLLERIESHRRIIQSERNTIGVHELRTRIVLIDPVLRMVGWAPEDPQTVLVEYSTGSGRADYALLGEDEAPAALVEAKGLGSRLEEHTRQVVNYATETGIGYAGITDGNQWMLYDVFRPVPMEDKRVMDVTLTRDEPVAAALGLLTGLTLPKMGRRSTTGNAKSPQEERTWEEQDRWAAIEALEEPPTIGGAGAQVRFPDQSTFGISSWQNAVGVVAKWLVTSGRLAEGRLPLRVGDCLHGIHWEPVHHDGARFYRKYEFTSPSGRRVYVHTHGTLKTSVNYIRNMLSSCGVAAKDVWVRVL